MTDRLISIRLPSDYLERADNLVDFLAARNPSFAMNRSVVLRLAIEKGLKAYEKDAEKKER